MQHRHRRIHAQLWTVLAVLLPAIVLVAMAIRQVGPVEAPSVRLEAPAASGTDAP